MHELPHALLVEHTLQQEEEPPPPPPGQPVRFSKKSIPTANGINDRILTSQN